MVFACQGIIDHPLGNLRQGGDKVLNLLVVDVDSKLYMRMKMGFCPPKIKHTLIHFVETKQCRLCVPTGVIPGVPALLCIVTLVIA